MKKKIELHQKAITLLSCIEAWQYRIKEERRVAKFHKHYINTNTYNQCRERIKNYEGYIEKTKEKYQIIINQIN